MFNQSVSPEPEDAVLTILLKIFLWNVSLVSTDVRKNMKKKFFFAESKSFEQFSCTLRIQFCQACQKNLAIVLILFQLMSKTDRVFFLQKFRKMFLWTRKTQFWQTCRKFLNKKPKKVSLNNEDDLNNTIFLKKKFFRDQLNTVLTSPPKSIFTERRKSFCSRSDFEAIFFGEKTSNFLRDN